MDGAVAGLTPAPTAQVTIPAVPSHDAMGLEFSSGMASLSGLLHGDNRSFDDIGDLIRQSAERATQKDELCASIVEGIDSVHARLAAALQALAESEAMREHEASLAQQVREQLWGIEQQAAGATARLRAMEDDLAAESAKLRRAACKQSEQRLWSAT